jgi:protein transport protein SEC13
MNACILFRYIRILYNNLSPYCLALPDRTIKIYNVFSSSYEHSATLVGHAGPVWQVSWAHPQFGTLLASASFDGSVLVHRESRPGEWTLVYAGHGLHQSSVNAVCFAPHPFGLMLAAASSDGRVSILSHQAQAANNTWAVDYLKDCKMGVNAVSWAPHLAYFDASHPDAEEVPRLVTAGCDNQIRFWVQQPTDGQWQLDACEISSDLTHNDWVRDVAWAPTLLPNQNMVASGSEDRTVLIWTQEGNNGAWKATLLHEFAAPVWRVSWSVTGYLLAVSSGDSDVSIWKAGLDGKWLQVSTVDETPVVAPHQTTPNDPAVNEPPEDDGYTLVEEAKV